MELIIHETRFNVSVMCPIFFFLNSFYPWRFFCLLSSVWRKIFSGISKSNSSKKVPGLLNISLFWFVDNWSYEDHLFFHSLDGGFDIKIVKSETWTERGTVMVVRLMVKLRFPMWLLFWLLSFFWHTPCKLLSKNNSHIRDNGCSAIVVSPI